MNILHQFATESTAETGLFAALGIDWRLLILQIIAFLLLVVVLGKFVYPWLMKQVDERQANIEAAQQAAVEAKKAAESNKEHVAELLDIARKEAAEIVETAKLESAELLKRSESKAHRAAQRIADEAKSQLDKDVTAARQSLRDETVELVALATEKIIGAELSAGVDNKRIVKTLEEAR